MFAHKILSFLLFIKKTTLSNYQHRIMFLSMKTPLAYLTSYLGWKHRSISMKTPLAYLASYLGRKKQQKQEQNGENNNIIGYANTDYRLVYHADSGTYILFFSAIVHLEQYDIQYFEKSRSGAMQTTVYGNGVFQFDPEEKELNSDGDYVIVANNTEANRVVSRVVSADILLEMV